MADLEQAMEGDFDTSALRYKRYKPHERLSRYLPLSGNGDMEGSILSSHFAGDDEI